MGGHPLVSVVVPVHNGARFLTATLESVVDQTYRPLEIIVVDDGSTDRSCAIAHSFPSVRYLHQANRGVAAARNAGVRAAIGSFLAFLDQDDLWRPGKIDAQMRLLLSDPAADYALTLHRRFVDPSGPAPSWVKPEWLGADLQGCEPSALLVRREAFDAVGPFNERYTQASDADWFFRASAHGCRAIVVPQALTLRRMHDANNSRFVAEVAAELRRVALEAMRRRRRTGEEG